MGNTDVHFKSLYVPIFNIAYIYGFQYHIFRIAFATPFLLIAQHFLRFWISSHTPLFLSSQRKTKREDYLEYVPLLEKHICSKVTSAILNLRGA
jgi:hypothetical protein